MTNISGIVIQTDSRGNLSKVTIDVKMHKAVILPVLHQMGVIKEDSFEQEWSESISVEKAEEDCLNFARNLWVK